LVVGLVDYVRGSAAEGGPGVEPRSYGRSTASATPMPPPMHSEARPFLALRRAISCSSVTSTRHPDAPIGWPSAIAPPLTLIFDVSQPISLLTAHACAANASLISIRSRSEAFQPAFSSAFFDAGTGPMPMIAGSTPDDANALIFAMGFSPSACARSALITSTAAAPSFKPDAFAAVTEPSFANAGFKP